MTENSVSDELEAEIGALRDDPRRPLRRFAPADERSPSPASVSLAAWATDIAERLHERFGSLVCLDVGFLEYPGRVVLDRGRVIARAPIVEQVDVNLEHPCQVASGHELHAEVTVRNRRRIPLAIRTNGQLTAAVLDPASGDVVGGFAGAQASPLVVFNAEPEITVQIPVLIGTASLEPRIGYAIPPGEWQFDVTFDFGELGRYRSAPLPLFVTS